MQNSITKSLFLSLVAFGLSASGLTLSAPAYAQNESAEDKELADTAMRFGIRGSVLDISLSPSGNKIAWIAAGPEHSEALNVIDLTSGAGAKTIMRNTQIFSDLAECNWATDEFLVCQTAGVGVSSDGVILPFDRLLAVNDDGTDVKRVTERESTLATRTTQFGGDIVALDFGEEPGQILVTRDQMREVATGTRLGRNEEGLAVDRFDIESGRRRPVERPDRLASHYVADGSGNVRIKVRRPIDNVGNISSTRIVLYRKKGSTDWEQLGASLNGVVLTDLRPIAIDESRDVAFAFERINGYLGLIEVPLDGSGKAEIVASRDDVDVAGLITIGRQQRVVGVSYATEKRSIEYFDPELKRLANGLAQALPNTPLINFAGASADESKLLIIAASDTDPGTVYLFNKNTMQLEILLAMRDYLVDRPMSPMAPITYAATDGTQVPGYLTLPQGVAPENLPAIVLPHGGPSARDFWGFDWMVQFFTARGYAVLQPNYRGSSGYGAAWYGRNGFRAWDVAIGDVNDAGRWLVSQGIADPDKLAIVGWSYGGYAALQSQVLDPNLYKAVVAIAPVTDLGNLIDDAQGYTNFELVRSFVGTGPHLKAGSPLQNIERFQAPVQLFHGTLDLNVAVRHSRDMEGALRRAEKTVEYHEYDDLQHGLSDSNVRTEMLTKIDEFLAASLAD
jgi:dipeptidyl aminopeptidase/acylaminoacyl peptidase